MDPQFYAIAAEYGLIDDLALSPTDLVEDAGFGGNGAFDRYPSSPRSADLYFNEQYEYDQHVDDRLADNVPALSELPSSNNREQNVYDWTVGQATAAGYRDLSLDLRSSSEAQEELSPTPLGARAHASISKASPLTGREAGGRNRGQNVEDGVIEFKKSKGVGQATRPSNLGASHDQDFASEGRVPVSKLPAPYKAMFKFSFFNPIQSKCLPTIYESNHNVLINAPTGSGKTVLFELAILRMLEYNPASKAVYMAPTKSLCSERFRDWSEKFRTLNVKCIELTGDSEHTGLVDAKLSNIIITTPEKWDSMTRRWFEFPKLLNKLRLLCIDEVHMLNDERGSVLEVIVARTKTFGTNIRLIALSATVPNMQDVAEWLGDGGVADRDSKAPAGQGAAKTFIFGNEYRPINLSKFVYGYTRRKEQTEYQFMSFLNFKIMDLIVTHSSGKPTLIFCGTRKSALQAAEAISKAYKKLIAQESKLPWKAPVRKIQFQDKHLTELSIHGIGIHHAGLDQEDRQRMEEMFVLNEINVLCTTSTLAVGVNLPARCVIIRGTKAYKGNTVDGFENYTDLDLIQMMGRAGRPQFDNEGVAVIMTTQSDKIRIEKLVNSETMLESCLHLNLTEHINSEINMGTITSHKSGIDWINNSFLSVRIKKNPKHYAIGDENIAPELQLKNFVEKAMNLLQADNLIEEENDQEIRATELGKIMSKFCLRHLTFLKLLHVQANATMRDLLDVISNADEYSTLRFRAGEVMVYRRLNSHAELKFPLIPGKITQPSHKVFLLIQAILGGIPLSEVKTDNTNPQMETNIIWQHLPRICKCLVALSTARMDVNVKSCLEIQRSVAARAWDNSPWVLRQLDQIGEKSVKRLVDAGIYTIQGLRDTTEHRVEMILDRNPPFGSRVLHQARSMPKFFCVMRTVSEEVVEDGVHVAVEVEVGLLEGLQPPAWRWKNSILMATVFVMTSDMKWIELRTIQIKLLVGVKRFTVECMMIKPSQNLIAFVSCNQIAGIGLTTHWSPSTPRENYPKPKLITDDEATVASVLDGLDMDDLKTSDAEVYLGSEKKSTPPRPPTPSNTAENSTQGAAAKESHRDSNCVTPAAQRLDNGRYRCGHQCKVACNHPCCIYGIMKPPKTKRPSNQNQSRSTKEGWMKKQSRPIQAPSGSAYQPAKQILPVAPYRTAPITRTEEDWRKFKELEAGTKIASVSPRTCNQPPKIPKEGKASSSKQIVDADDLPSLDELLSLEFQLNPNKEPAKIKAPEKDVKSSLSSGERLPALVYEAKKTQGKERPISPGVTGRGKTSGNNCPLSNGIQAVLSGVEKFRNKNTISEDFDERKIFDLRKHKRIASSDKISQDKSGAKVIEVSSESNSRSSPDMTHNYAPQKEEKAEVNVGATDEETEIDELDEIYDVMKVFEEYLVSEDEDDLGAQSKMGKKRSKDQTEDKEDAVGKDDEARKKTKVDPLSWNLSLNKEVNQSQDDPRATQQAAAVEESMVEDSFVHKLGKEDRPVMPHDQLLYSDPPPISWDSEPEEDSLMKALDDVIAWAETKVGKESEL